MVKKRSKVSSSGNTVHRFLDIPLSQAAREDLSGYDLEVEFPYDLVEALVTEGYKFSLTFDGRNQTYIASLTDRLPESPWQNTTLSGRGSTALNARCALLYRHLVMADGDWSTLNPDEARPPADFE